MRVLSTTTSGHLGFLDIPSREYTVLTRSHMAPVLALSTEQNRGQMATVSLDHTVRIWDLATLQQVGSDKRQTGDRSRCHTKRLWAGDLVLPAQSLEFSVKITGYSCLLGSLGPYPPSMVAFSLQLYDFSSSDETPCAVAFHPTLPNFFCGFSSGAVRSFSLENSEVLVEHT